MKKSIESYWHKFVKSGGELKKNKFLFKILVVFSRIYSLIWESYLLLYRLKILKKEKLPLKVISVGNITLGGTGKTSTVEMLAREHLKKEQSLAILLRGYGGQRKGRRSLVSDGRKILMTAQEAGDEAYLLAKCLPQVPVLVGKNRVLTAEIARRRLGVNLVILDDGYQYLKLFKDEEVVLIDATSPFGNNYLFPAGTLRERKENLRRANSILLTKVDQISLEEVKKLKEVVFKLNPQAEIFEGKYLPLHLRDLKSSKHLDLSLIKGKRVAAFSGIGDPSSFERMLRRLEASFVLIFRFADHHFYTEEEIEEIMDESLKNKIEMLITTEKDAVRIPPSCLGVTARRQVPDKLPFLVLGVKMTIRC